ncbi:MAG: GNAT family N-acetyltransferase [Candidatus Bathyarchaeia archaeon]
MPTTYYIAIHNFFFIFPPNEKIVAFVTLQMAEIKRVSLSRKDRLQIGRDRYPAVHIGQLAVHVDYENNGVGTYVLDWSIGKAMKISVIRSRVGYVRGVGIKR